MAFLIIAKRIVIFLVFGVIALYTLLWFQLGPGEVNENDQEFRLVENILSGYELELLDSYTMSGSWAGDIETGFSARVTDFSESAIEQLAGTLRGDQLSEELEYQVDFISGLYGGGELAWFPSKQEILHSDYYVYPVAGINGEGYADSVRLLILHPADQMIFFGWVKI